MLEGGEYKLYMPVNNSIFLYYLFIIDCNSNILFLWILAYINRVCIGFNNIDIVDLQK
jgi:hypothetical protein